MSSFDLGTIICPSGAVLVVDPGYLNLWCHDQQPLMPEGLLSTPADTAKANRSIDLEFVGPDAEALGKAWDRQWHSRYLYDMAPDYPETVERHILELSRERGLSARLQPLPERVSHRKRVDIALAHGFGAGVVQFNGIWACAVGDLPVGELRVVGEPMPEMSPDSGRMRRVRIVCGNGEVSKSEEIGKVMVDWARLIVIDVDALQHWSHEKPLDGRADFVFWGRDAATAAKRLKAGDLGNDQFGWRDLPAAEAEAHGRKVVELRDRAGLKMTTDFRPHSHHYQLMEQVRRSETESGVVTLGGARACGFMSTWGDGLFDVNRDLDAEGRLVAIGIELGTPERQRLMRRIEFRWSTFALVSQKIMEGGEPVRFMYREAPDREGDSGWRFMSGLEDDAYNDNPQNIAVVRLADVADRDKRVSALLEEPEGTVLERKAADADFVKVTDWKPDD